MLAGGYSPAQAQSSTGWIKSRPVQFLHLYMPQIPKTYTLRKAHVRHCGSGGVGNWDTISQQLHSQGLCPWAISAHGPVCFCFCWSKARVSFYPFELIRLSHGSKETLYVKPGKREDIKFTHFCYHMPGVMGSVSCQQTESKTLPGRGPLGMPGVGVNLGRRHIFFVGGTSLQAGTTNFKRNPLKAGSSLFLMQMQ